MDESIPTQASSLHLDEERDGQRSVVIRPLDNDIFVRTGRQVIEACRLGISIEVWTDELNSMLGEVREWSMAHTARVRACFVAARGARVVLLFAPRGECFDFDLADELAELNTALVRKYNVGMTEIHQIPWAEVDRFTDPDSARLIHGQQPPTPRRVEA